MIKRDGDADAVALGQAQRFADEEAVVEDVVVRQRGAFGESGRPGGVLDVNGIVEVQRLFPL